MASCAPLHNYRGGCTLVKHQCCLQEKENLKNDYEYSCKKQASKLSLAG